MNLEGIVPGRSKITPVMTQGVMDLNLTFDVVVVMIVYALREWSRSDGDAYFHTYRTESNDTVEVTDGNIPVFTYPKGQMEGITEMIYTIVDDYGDDSDEGLVVTILLPREY